MLFNIFGKKTLGLDISDHSMEAVSLSGSLKSPRLLALARIKLDPGVVENGLVHKKKELTDRLKTLIASPQFGRFTEKRAVLALPESRSFVHHFDILEKVSPDKERKIIIDKAKENFPFPLEKIYFDYRIRKTEEKKDVLLAAIPKDVVNSYVEILKECQLEPMFLELESESIARSLQEVAEKPFLLADIGARTTNLSVIDESGLTMSVSLPVAGNAFSRSLIEQLRVLPEEAEMLKREVGLDYKKEKGRVLLVLQKEIQKIIEEIRGVDDYLEKRGGNKTKVLVLAGGSAPMPYLSNYMSENLEKPVVIHDPWVKINIDILRKKENLKKALRINPVLYATVIGSALRGLTKNPREAGLNFLPKGRSDE